MENSLREAASRLREGFSEEPEILELETGGGAAHSSILPSKLDRILKNQNLAVSELSLIAAGRGPGSFTGLRTGLAFAKGLAFGGVPAAGVPSLAALASAFGLPPGLYAPVLDARHKELFTQLYRRSPEGLPAALTGILVLRPESFYRALREILPDSHQGRGALTPVAVIGPGGALLPEPEEGFVIGSLQGPAAPALACLGARLMKTEGPELNPLLPLYGRSPEIFKTWTPPSRLPSS